MSFNPNAENMNSNLLKCGDFQSLEPWQPNETLSKFGRVTQSDDGIVEIHSPVIDLDGSLWQLVQTQGHTHFHYSLKLKFEAASATLCVFALDDSEAELSMIMFQKPVTLGWRTYHGVIEIPPNATKLKVLLNVINGTACFANVAVRPVDAPAEPLGLRTALSPQGFAVTVHSIERPFWELFCDDLDGDGQQEIVGCDVDGLVTIRRVGDPPFATFDAGALVYQFAAADLNGDGIKEILLSSIDPKIPVRAIDLAGNLVQVFAHSCGHERIATADMDGDGNVEVAISKGNGIPMAGVADGLILYSNSGQVLWEKDELVREFQFADISPEPGMELVVCGPQIEFRTYDRKGIQLSNHFIEDERIEHFRVADIDADGTMEIVATTMEKMLCCKGESIVWQNATANERHHLAIGNFNPDTPGLETLLVGAHAIHLYDSTGALVYQNKEKIQGEYWEKWVPDGINSLDIAVSNEHSPTLFLSSSRYRHPAYYQLIYGGKDHLREYKPPDQESHLEDIYRAIHESPALPANSAERMKILFLHHGFARHSEATLRHWRAKLDSMETPNVEYLAMFEASDLVGHRRGTKMTTDQIAERAKLLEHLGIPFGYFAAHSTQVWLSEEAIRRSKESAPTMFRFVYIAENMETFYTSRHDSFLQWVKKTISFCAAHNMNMIFKEKHDAWGTLTADPELSAILFRPDYRDVTVPIWATNQVYHPEVQIGGMLGLKSAGLCKEFGMSTQFWNWHEWGRYPRGIRDVTAAFVCPSDIMLRLELMGIALGATWVHIEAGQPYMREDITDGFAPMATRHREISYELVRKNFLTPGAMPENLSKTVVVRSEHPEMAAKRKARTRISYPYYSRNTNALRRGFIPARYLFETYPTSAFPYIAYSSAWHGITCFPQTPNGWVPIVPQDATIPSAAHVIRTDGENVLLDETWMTAEDAAPTAAQLIAKGASHIPLQAPGACVILQSDPAGKNIYRTLLIDPGYLAPTGVNTTLVATSGRIADVKDIISGESVECTGGTCQVQIQPGAFRLLQVTLDGV